MRILVGRKVRPRGWHIDTEAPLRSDDLVKIGGSTQEVTRTSPGAAFLSGGLAISLHSEIPRLRREERTDRDDGGVVDTY